MTAPAVSIQDKIENAVEEFKDMSESAQRIAIFEKLVFLEEFALKTIALAEKMGNNPMLAAMLPPGILPK